MNRDKIRIVEFGMDDKLRPPSRPSKSETMKIVEFDDDREPSRQSVATGQDVGKIKIVEFDDDLPRVRSMTRERPKAKPGPMKIVEFDEDTDAIGNAGGSPKIKIMEFE